MVAMVTYCVTKITPTIFLGRSKETLSQGIWADSVSPRMNTIASLDQFQPRRSGENFFVICNDIQLVRVSLKTARVFIVFLQSVIVTILPRLSVQLCYFFLIKSLVETSQQNFGLLSVFQQTEPNDQEFRVTFYPYATQLLVNKMFVLYVSLKRKRN